VALPGTECYRLSYCLLWIPVRSRLKTKLEPARSRENRACKLHARARISSLNPEYLHDHAFAALAVELCVEHPLPGSEVELAIGHRQCRFMVKQQRL
jgi:hypothetical protein